MAQIGLKNRIFEWDGIKHRILHVDDLANIAYCIDIENRKSWPVALALSAVAELPPVVGEPTTAPPKMTKLELDCMNKAWSCLGPFLQLYEPTQLFDPKERKKAIDKHANALGCAPSTLYKYLQRYWQRGQVPAALIPDFRRPARNDMSTTDSTREASGPKYEVDGEMVDPYQLDPDDFKCMKNIIESKLLTNRRKKVSDAYTDLVAAHYMLTDGNGKPYRAPDGQLPSLRQFRYFYNKHYDIETRLRAKHGDKNFNLNYRAVLGRVGQDTPFPGHSYEIDATILPVTAVAMHDGTYIVGRPTLYLIICRASRLIVGYYLGIEHASWMAAMAAIYSIVEDKRALCERYGVTFRPEDWPADGILPSEFITDRGSEWTSRMSDDFVARTGCTVKNLPAGRADWKPFVENCHRLIQDVLRTFEPSFNPDSNANARQSVDYGKDACCNLHILNGFVLRCIIELNNRVLLGYQPTLEQITSDFVLTPVNLWNDGIEKSSGVLTSTTEDDVRFQLLPRVRGTVTKEGIVLKHLTYLVDPDMADKLFIRARRESFRVDISYDPRLVDSVFIHDLTKSGGPTEATLSPRSKQYAGLSFDEVARIEDKRRKNNRNAVPSRHEGRIALLNECKPIAEAALAQMQELTQGKSRSTRRDRIADDRIAERTQERQSASLTAKSRTSKGAKSSSDADAITGPITTPSLSGKSLPPVLNLVKAALAARTQPTNA